MEYLTFAKPWGNTEYTNLKKLYFLQQYNVFMKCYQKYIFGMNFSLKTML